ncbi:uncharacterized protein LOC144619627 [Crassostrea virginica]
MQINLQDHVPTISIGGRPICNLRFADDIDLMGGSNGQLLDLISKSTALVHLEGTCTAEVRIRIARATASMASLQKIWRSNISFKTKYKLYHSLVLSTLLYGCETWTLMADTEKRI